MSGITDDQKKRYSQLIENAGHRALTLSNIDGDGVRRLLKQGGAFTCELEALIVRFSVSNRFANEEVTSTYGYGSGYNVLKPVAEQASILRAEFPQLGSFDEILAVKTVPDWMEGNFAIPYWPLIAPTYGQAVERIIAAIAAKRPFYSYRKEQLGLEQLRETAKKAEAIKQLRKQQTGHDILVMPGQFGKRHAGRSARRACEVMSGREFGFGAYEVAIMLFTHPERLADYEDLWIECAGDEAALKANGSFSSCPGWTFQNKVLCFYFSDNHSPHAHCGSASGYLLECAS